MVSIPKLIKDYPIIPAAASFWEPGLGQILCGKINTAISLLIPRIIFQLYFFFGGSSYIQVSFSSININMAFSLMISALRIWATYNAYTLAKNLGKK